MTYEYQLKGLSLSVLFHCATTWVAPVAPVGFSYMLMDTAVPPLKWSLVFLLVCSLLRATTAVGDADSAAQDVQDHQYRQRIVGGTTETNEVVAQWQALFLKDGSLSPFPTH